MVFLDHYIRFIKETILNRLLSVILVFILTMGGLITSCSPSTPIPAQAPQVGKLAPDFQLPNLEGESISLRDFRGRPVLINFWATWCYYCIVEMPFLQEVYDEWSNKGLVVLAIDMGESLSRVKKFIEDYHFSFPVLLDVREEVANKYNIRPIPTTFFIDKDGVIREIKIGAFQSEQEIENSLNKILVDN
jgi:peroxiredoxin